MPSTAIVWFRRDLRVHDHPPLRAALAAHDQVVPAFVLDPRLLEGRFASPLRAAFLHGCLKELDAALRARGAGLVIREGDPATALPELATEANASAVYWAADVSPFATRRDAQVAAALEGLDLHETQGNFCADLGELKPYRVFTPYHRAWLRAERRQVGRAPRAIPMPKMRKGRLPSRSPGQTGDFEPGEAAARQRLAAWARAGAEHYATTHDDLAKASSRLSPYLHFGCVSAREVEERTVHAPEFRRQLAWRDFYGQLLLHHPEAATKELQPRYRELEWDEDDELLEAWREGRTGYPLVDAGMRQLRGSGWMHNRARLVVGSFRPRTCTSTGGPASVTSCATCSTVTRRTTTATGSGSPRWAPIRRRISVACSIRQPSSSGTTRTASTCAAGCRSCAMCPSSTWPSPGR